jgi:hypothetical protein
MYAKLHEMHLQLKKNASDMHRQAFDDMRDDMSISHQQTCLGQEAISCMLDAAADVIWKAICEANAVHLCKIDDQNNVRDIAKKSGQNLSPLPAKLTRDDAEQAHECIIDIGFLISNLEDRDMISRYKDRIMVNVSRVAEFIVAAQCEMPEIVEVAT